MPVAAETRTSTETVCSVFITSLLNLLGLSNNPSFLLQEENMKLPEHGNLFGNRVVSRYGTKGEDARLIAQVKFAGIFYNPTTEEM